MRIVYVAKHGNTDSADDEGAIAYALESLGHSVVRVQEQHADRFHGEYPDGDFVLCHHWYGLPELWERKRIKIPVVYWCFDLIDYPKDPSTAPRCEARKAWATKMLKICDLGFHTDGDWVVSNNNRKLHWLSQGVNERIVGLGNPDAEIPVPNGVFIPARIPILFAGSHRCGIVRRTLVQELRNCYNGRFFHVYRGIWGRNFANLIARSCIIVGPDSPITDRYFSNRIFMVSGFGGFLLHPRCGRLTEMYQDDKEIVYYDNRDDLFQKIDYYLEHPDERKKVAQAALERTLLEHTYTHRCRKLIDVVQRQLRI